MQKILNIFILLLFASQVFAQQQDTIPASVGDTSVVHFNDTLALQLGDTLALQMSDTLGIPGDSTMVTVDSLEIPRRHSVVDIPVQYECEDSLMVSLTTNNVYMYGSTKVKSGSMELESDFMQIEVDTHIAYAEGTEDTITHEIKGKPKFKDNRDEFTAKTIKYNFDTKEGYVCEVNTKQQGGYLYGERTRIHANREIHLKNGRYTTCDIEEHPHFYFELTRAKFIPDDKIIAGPSYLVLLDVPVYVLGVPFGIFPASKRRQSGVIIPKYGEESKRGLYLQDGGYYFAISDYCDLQMMASFYTYGGWGAKVVSKFKVRYKFTGNLNFSYSKNITGVHEFADIKGAHQDVNYTSMNSYSLTFNFNQDPKANPHSSFGANVSYQKSRYDLQNSTRLADITKNTTQSSVNYQTTMFNIVNLGINSNMTQNFADTSISFTFPTIALSVSKFFPFKRKVQVGKQRWYEKIGSSFQANFTNSVDRINDTLFMKREMFDKMRYGFEYSMPINMSFNVLKYINVSPSIQYKGRIYPNYVVHYMNPQVAFGDTYSEYVKYGVDTINHVRHNMDFSTSVSASTKLYGIFNFKNAKHIKAFRHVLTPSVGLAWRPDFADPMWDYYRQDPLDTTFLKKYSIFETGIYGYPPQGKSAAITFGLGNNFEMKVKTKKDTIEGKYTKVKLLETLNFSGSYNLAADSCKLSNISINAGTRLFDKVSVTMSGTLDPYKLDSAGRRTRYYLFKTTNGHRWGRLTYASISTSYSIDSKTFKKNSAGSSSESSQYGSADYDDEAEVDEFGNIIATAEEVEERRKEREERRKRDDGEYSYYSVPWSLSGGYSFSYSHPGRNAAVISQMVNVSGSITFTDKWRLSMSTGYDIQEGKFATSSLTVIRDLHCFSLSFNIIPYGMLKSYNFRISFGSSLFQGLEYKRNQTWRDN
ncbi:MAG: LPS-assembly protein LptD [Bacteroidales bacterium]|nr:LPS-assembly protein LptD [Bacteroidales bacterium]